MSSRRTVAVAILASVLAFTPPVHAQLAGGGTLTGQDYIEIQQLYARYTRMIDGGDAEGYAALFTPDGSFNNNKGHDALVAFIKNRNGANLRHMNVNLVILPTPEGASGSVYNFFLNVGERPPVITAASQYEDTLVKTPQGWRFKTRVNRTEGPPAAAAPQPPPAAPPRQ